MLGHWKRMTLVQVFPGDVKELTGKGEATEEPVKDTEISIPQEAVGLENVQRDVKEEMQKYWQVKSGQTLTHSINTLQRIREDRGGPFRDQNGNLTMAMEAKDMCKVQNELCPFCSQKRRWHGIGEEGA